MDRLRIQTPEGISFSFLPPGESRQPDAGVADRFRLHPRSDRSTGAVDFSAVDCVRRLGAGHLPDAVFRDFYRLRDCVRIPVARTDSRQAGVRLRVLDARGLHLALNQIVLRNLLRAIDSLPFLYAIGGVMSLLNRYSQRLGDLAGNTIVIRNPIVAQPDLDKLIRGRFNSLLSYPHLQPACGIWYRHKRRASD